MVIRTPYYPPNGGNYPDLTAGRAPKDPVMCTVVTPDFTPDNAHYQGWVFSGLDPFTNTGLSVGGVAVPRPTVDIYLYRVTPQTTSFGSLTTQIPTTDAQIAKGWPQPALFQRINLSDIPYDPVTNTLTFLDFPTYVPPPNINTWINIKIKATGELYYGNPPNQQQVIALTPDDLLTLEKYAIQRGDISVVTFGNTWMGVETDPNWTAEFVINYLNRNLPFSGVLGPPVQSGKSFLLTAQNGTSATFTLLDSDLTQLQAALNPGEKITSVQSVLTQNPDTLVSVLSFLSKNTTNVISPPPPLPTPVPTITPPSGTLPNPLPQTGHPISISPLEIGVAVAVAAGFALLLTSGKGSKKITA